MIIVPLLGSETDFSQELLKMDELARSGLAQISLLAVSPDSQTRYLSSTILIDNKSILDVKYYVISLSGLYLYKKIIIIILISNYNENSSCYIPVRKPTK